MRLGVLDRLGYGVGHILNDLCASLWFSYILVFYNLVVGFSSVNAGAILLVGQIADALSTPTVGFLSDRTKLRLFLKYGKRKTWHLIGTCCVVVSVPFMYSPCINCMDKPQWQQLIYYSFFVVIFQFGWASTQISHLSLVPDLTPDENERTSLLSVRYSFTVLSNMAVYVVTWIVFEMSDTGGSQITSKDMIKFQEIAYIIVVIGTLTSILFHCLIKENKPEPLLQGESQTTLSQESRLPIKELFTNLRLYEVAVIYMSVRLFCNLSQSLVPLYLHDVLHLGATSIAIIPLVMYLSSFFTSLFTRPLNTYLGRQLALLLGAVIALGGCFWVLFGVGILFSKYWIYCVAILLGCATSILLVTSLAITADLIGTDIGNGAFVYGLMSFVDKLSCGLAIMVIQTLKPDRESAFYQNALAYVCGGAVILGAAFISSSNYRIANCGRRSSTTEESDREPQPGPSRA